jgi:hypothetical protein
MCVQVHIFLLGSLSRRSNRLRVFPGRAVFYALHELGVYHTRKTLRPLQHISRPDSGNDHRVPPKASRGHLAGTGFLQGRNGVQKKDNLYLATGA